MNTLLIVFYFFSSRRRHTSLQGDWSSDVCSSDLDATEGQHQAAEARAVEDGGGDPRRVAGDHVVRGRAGDRVRALPAEIGRASCRERVLLSVNKVTLDNKIVNYYSFDSADQFYLS